MDPDKLFKDLPGHELIAGGLADLARGKNDSVEALLIGIGRPRLLKLGFDLPYRFSECPEHDLYRQLGDSHGDAAHSRYNALIRRLVSFSRALEGIQIRKLDQKVPLND